MDKDSLEMARSTDRHTNRHGSATLGFVSVGILDEIVRKVDTDLQQPRDLRSTVGGIVGNVHHCDFTQR